MRKKLLAGALSLCGICHLGQAAAQSIAHPRQSSQSSKATTKSGNITGTVRGAKGAEAGVWVIAEALNLPTKFRKIVVTDSDGRFLVPDLPSGRYKPWVRGYGRVDSKPIPVVPGNEVALRAIPAPTARAAAQVYPANYWYSLIHAPTKSEFPIANSANV